jgi:hypothetical protein
MNASPAISTANAMSSLVMFLFRFINWMMAQRTEERANLPRRLALNVCLGKPVVKSIFLFGNNVKSGLKRN